MAEEDISSAHLQLDHIKTSSPFPPDRADSTDGKDKDGPTDLDRGNSEGEKPLKDNTKLRRSRRKLGSSPSEKSYIGESTSAGAKSSIPVVKRKRPTRGNWSAQHLLSSPNSKLTCVNLQSLLTHEKAWTALSKEQQLHLIRMLPGMSQFDSEGELPNMLADLLKTNTSFQADVRLFKEDLQAGRYEQRWLNDAKNAMEKRARGVFDDWKESNREEFWGQKQRIDWSALAGESSEHQLSTLVAAGYFKVDDVWVLRRGTKKEKEKEAVVVEKEAKITNISPSYEMSFSFPPAQYKFSAPANGEDKTVTNIAGPRQLSKAILAEDGRIVGVRDSNSWKEFRCFRKNQDMGSLWDIRELYHQRQQKIGKS